MNYIAALKRNPNKRPGNYWKDTSHNDIIKQFVGRRDMDVSKKFEILLAGGSIKVLPSEDLTYNFEKATEREFWSILYLTGYLTSADRDPEAVADGELSLRIPNEEVRIIFKDTIVEWFQSTMLDLNREALKQIDDRFYGEDIREDYDTVICYGIAFYKKRCRILLKNA